MLENNKNPCDKKSVTVQFFYRLTALFLMVFLITACGKGDKVVTEEGASKKAGNGTTLYLKLVDDKNALLRNLDQSTTVRVVATLISVDNEAISGEVIEFSTNVGTLDKTNGLTNALGRSEINLLAGTLPKAGQVTAIVQVAGNDLAVSYGFIVGGTIDNTSQPNPNPNPGTGSGATSKSDNGNMQFVSAAPTRIVLKSTGGAGLSELSTVTFRLVGTDGLPMSGQTVDFSINNPIGGIAIEPTSAITDFNGLVNTVLHAGTVPTSVRVEATTTITKGISTNIIFSQSDMLAVGVGTPDQNSMSLSLSTRAPEAWHHDGEIVDVTIRLGDHFNNFIPDGTSVYFTTEGGVIEPSCETTDSACTVKWISSNPRPADHRVTILATTLGSESFQDTDSDGVYSVVDGEPFIDINQNGIYDEPFTDEGIMNGKFDEPFLRMGNGKYDTGETFVDAKNGYYDEGEDFVDVANGKFDSGEVFTDANNNGNYDAGEAFVDVANGVWDVGEVFTDAVNGRFDPNEVFVDAVNSVYDIGDIFIDYNGNGVFDGVSTNPDGETVFVDSNNGNGLYDGSGRIPEGEESIDKNANSLFDGPGFADLGEPFLDANENFKRDVDELYFDTNGDGGFSQKGDGLFNGIYCKASDAICSSEKTLRIRKSAVLVMSSSFANIAVTDRTSNIIYISNIPGIDSNSEFGYVDARIRGSSIIVYFGDSAGQVLPEGTTVSVTADVGELSGVTDGILPNNQIKPLGRGADVSMSERMQNGLNSFGFSISDKEADKEEFGKITITFTTPKEHVTSFTLSVLI